MVRVVGVRFKMAGKVYYFDPAELPITAGNKVIVETVRGVEYGEVVVGPKDVEDDQVVQPLKKVVRIGTERDVQIATENKRKEKDAFGVAAKKIEGHNLDMYLVDVEYTFDGSKIIFYFTAEGRVDFRELVRDLAGVFRTRIEMRQIGVRDEAKLLGGIGPCGRILCCTSFLGDFAPVSIRMAKDQNLSLNPSKISGLCGRLMCCLRYEQETYEAAKKDPTLSPGYVPPAVAELDVPAFDELEEDRPTPAIGVKGRGESGFSARIAQAAGVITKPETRKERPQRPEGDRERQGGGGGPVRLPGEKLSGERFRGERQGEGAPTDAHKARPDKGGPRPEQEGRRPPEQGRREGRPQGERQGQSGGQGRRDGKPQGERQGQPGGQPQQGGRRDGKPQGERQGQPGGQPQQGGRRDGQKPQGDRNKAQHSHTKGQQGGQQPNEQERPQASQSGGERQGGGSNRRRRRRRGARPEGGGQQGGPTNPAE